MGLDTKKRPFFVDLLGEDRVTALEESLPQINKDLEEAGVAWKDLEDALASEDSGEGEGDGESKGDATSAGEGDGDGEAASDDGDGDGDGAGEGDAAPAGVGVDEKTLEGFKAILEPVTASLKEIGNRLEKLEKSDDEKIASRMQQASVANGKRPSESTDNVIDDEKTKDLDKPDGENQEVGGQTAAARQIVDELLLGKKPSRVS